MTAKKYHQGYYRPSNPHKYRGNVNGIVFRSGWELKFFRDCDLNESILSWSSESTIVPYRNPLTGTVHRYFVDVTLKYKATDGSIKKMMVEIKPQSQIAAPKPQARKTKKYLKEVETYVINRAKWDAAEKYAEKYGMTFALFNEHTLGIA